MRHEYSMYLQSLSTVFSDSNSRLNTFPSDLTILKLSGVRSRNFFFLLVCFHSMLVVVCGSQSQIGNHTPADKLLQPPKPLMHKPPKTESIPKGPSETDMQRAGELKRMDNVAYTKGLYDEAEALLKRSILLYPMMPLANLLLGKVFLVRGSAIQDYGMIRSARTRFEMERTIDPSLAETDILLELFWARPVD